MKVIQILPELNAGGVERGTLEVGLRLTREGHESIVISHGGRLVERLEAEGSRHVTLPVHRKHLSSLSQVKVLRNLFEQEKPDIIHLRSRVPAWLAWLAWRKMDPATRPRLVTTVHGFYSVNFYSKVMTRGEAVICVSNSVKDYVTTNYPDTDEAKLTVIHRGVSPGNLPNGFQADDTWLDQWREKNPQLANQYVITLPGRITRWKGQLDFISVIAHLKKQGLPVHGLIVGAPHPRKLKFFEEVKASINAADLHEDITLLGHRSDIREIMSVSDVIVSCSTDPEAFGRVTLEALAIGKPVAGYDHGGVHEQLQAMLPEGRIAIGDTHAMSELLIEWQNNRPAPKKDYPFTLDNMLSKTLSVYEHLMSAPRS